MSPLDSDYGGFWNWEQNFVDAIYRKRRSAYSAQYEGPTSWFDVDAIPVESRWRRVLCAMRGGR